MAIQLHTKSSEVRLMEMLGRIQSPTGWQALHFHLSDLLEQYKSEYQIKIAVNLVYDLLKNYNGGVFLMSDQNIIVVCQGLEKIVQNKLIFQLRYLYMDDPLAYTEDGNENPALCTIYDLARSWQEFFAMASKRMAVSVRRPSGPVEKKPKAPETPARKDAPASASSESKLFSAPMLAQLESELRASELTHAIRRQPVCAAGRNSTMRRVFDELYVHIAHMRQMIKSDVDFFSNRWLFKYLTQILDERMIEMIRRNPAQFTSSPISLNLNVETLLSSWFEAFDESMPPGAKVSVVIEVPVIDVFADMRGFMLAKNSVQKLGYRVCLDGLTVDSFVNINREKLGLDLIKVQWNADAASDLGRRENRELAKAVETTGSNRVILCRCDNREAVEYGQAMGISLFQGRYVDSVLDPASEVEN